MWNAEKRDEMQGAGLFAYPQTVLSEKGKNEGIVIEFTMLSSR